MVMLPSIAAEKDYKYPAIPPSLLPIESYLPEAELPTTYYLRVSTQLNSIITTQCPRYNATSKP
ncbi:hypothetical protein CPC08DRAFT_713649 [Agrocybe pediades]|nr:hypothetical protein CPC08DRAFT_713649 [Agrocybe pediades]